MLRITQIVCRTIVLAGGAALLVACGQRGPLYLPDDAAAANRATLPQTLDPRGDTPQPVMQAPATPGAQKP